MNRKVLFLEKRLMEIKNLKPGGFVIVDDAPCRVDSVQVSKSGKHGAAKVRLTVVGLFDWQKRIIVKPADSRMDVPIIEKKTAQVVAIVGDNVQLMDTADFSMSEVRIPDELKGKIKEGDEVSVWQFGPNVMIKGTKGSS